MIIKKLVVHHSASKKDTTKKTDIDDVLPRIKRKVLANLEKS